MSKCRLNVAKLSISKKFRTHCWKLASNSWTRNKSVKNGTRNLFLKWPAECTKLHIHVPYIITRWRYSGLHLLWLYMYYEIATTTINLLCEWATGRESTGERIDWGENRLGRESTGERIDWGENRLGRESTGERIDWGENRLERESTGERIDWGELTGRGNTRSGALEAQHNSAPTPIVFTFNLPLAISRTL